MSELQAPEVEIKQLLDFVCRSKASDLHLKVGYAPYVRIGGHLKKVDTPPIPDTDYMERMMGSLIPPGKTNEYDKNGGLDFARGLSHDIFQNLGWTGSGKWRHRKWQEFHARCNDGLH